MKRISVIDQQGNVYEPTYPKRAKGLLKKGRARFVDENTICLTCPLPEKREETIMMVSNQTAGTEMVTVAEIFEELKQIRENTSHIDLAMEKLEKVPTGDSADEAVCIEKMTAILKVVEAREATNQALIHLYEKMYDDVQENADVSGKIQ